VKILSEGKPVSATLGRREMKYQAERRYYYLMDSRRTIHEPKVRIFSYPWGEVRFMVVGIQEPQRGGCRMHNGWQKWNLTDRELIEPPDVDYHVLFKVSECGEIDVLHIAPGLTREEIYAL
jgi:hypothetical protein